MYNLTYMKKKKKNYSLFTVQRTPWHNYSWVCNFRDVWGYLQAYNLMSNEDVRRIGPNRLSFQLLHRPVYSWLGLYKMSFEKEMIDMCVVQYCVSLFVTTIVVVE